MVCRFCRKPIGFFRKIADGEFCSAEHRKRGMARSARVLRQLSDPDEFTAPEDRPRQGGAPGGLVFGLAALLTAGLVVMEKPGTAPANAPAPERESESGVLDSLLDRLPQASLGGLSMEEGFAGSLRDWRPAPGADGWKIENGLAHLGGLRIWEGSRNLADYTFAFEGRVENRALGWVVRAPNHRNYYAAKLAIMEGRAEIVRFAVMEGKELGRQRFPIPLELERNRFYRVEMKAAGDRLQTSIGGRVVDQWRDGRFRSGGVGFFSEDGDRASIRWARVREGGSFGERLRGYLTFGMVLR